jgi:hypothetical protein
VSFVVALKTAKGKDETAGAQTLYYSVMTSPSFIQPGGKTNELTGEQSNKSSAVD